MSWYYESGSTWTRRASASVDNTAGGAGAIDIEIVVPATWTQFWDEIDASGNELRVADADGVAKLVYAWSGFNRTNRTGTIQIDGYIAPEAGMLQVWLYWRASGAASGAAAVVIAAPKTGYVEQCLPPLRVEALPMRPGDLRPATRLQKATDETIMIAFDVGPLLSRRRHLANGHRECDEIDAVTYTIETGGAAVGSMVDATKTRIVGGRLLLLLAKAGSVDVNYTIHPVLKTTDGLTLTPRAWLLVINQDEA